MKPRSYRHTVAASFVGYVVQAIVNCFAPLLYITFGNQYGIGLEQISLLILLNFGTQLVMDFVFSQLAGKISFRILIPMAHFFAALGMAGLALFPPWFPTPLSGLAGATLLSAVGGGLIEVLLSPTVEACPAKNKGALMSLLHSFFAWGQVLVVLGSTLWFQWVGIETWKSLTLLWAAIPLLNGIWFLFVPLYSLEADTKNPETQKPRLARSGMFWTLMLLMVCAGAAESAMSQWVSAFAEKGLGLSKTAGDLLGTMMFAAMIGLSRVFYARMSKQICLQKFMLACSVLCVISYLSAALSPLPLLGLAGCGLCGLSVGILWPGTYNLAASKLKGGASMFALLALGGDLGCAAGPALAGLVSDRLFGSLKAGLFLSAIFPFLLIGGLLCLGKKKIKT